MIIVFPFFSFLSHLLFYTKLSLHALQVNSHCQFRYTRFNIQPKKSITKRNEKLYRTEQLAISSSVFFLFTNGRDDHWSLLLFYTFHYLTNISTFDLNYCKGSASLARRYTCPFITSSFCTNCLFFFS